MIGLYEKLCIMIGMVKNNNKKYMMGFKKVFYNSIKWLEMIELYEKLCIMIGMVKNNNNKYMMGLFKLYSSDPWVLFNLDPGMGFWIKTRFEYWILLRNKHTINETSLFWFLIIFVYIKCLLCLIWYGSKIYWILNLLCHVFEIKFSINPCLIYFIFYMSHEYIIKY
jgi:hypothetical protein